MAKVLDKKTGRFYIAFSSKLNQPIWSQPHRPSQAAVMTPVDAAQVIKELQLLAPSSYDLQLVL